MERTYYIEKRVNKIFKQNYFSKADIAEAGKLIDEYKTLTNWEQRIKNGLV